MAKEGLLILSSTMNDCDSELDVFYFAFSVLRSAIREVAPNVKYWIYPGITWKK